MGAGGVKKRPESSFKFLGSEKKFSLPFSMYQSMLLNFRKEVSGQLE